MSGFYNSTYFVLTDEDGNIVSEVKYVNGTTNVAIMSPKTYKKDRFNFFKIDITKDASVTKSIIHGFLQIKRGSHYNSPSLLLPQKPVHELAYHLKKPVYFDQLNIQGDIFGTTIKSLTDTVFQLYPALSDDSKLWVQLHINNIRFYNFFDVPKGATNFDVDMTQINKTPLVKNITSPGTGLSIQIYARPDKRFFNRYDLGAVTSATNQLGYYYPQETFDEYVTYTSYSIGNAKYSFTRNSSSIADNADTYNAVINTPTSTLTTFKPSFSGDVDYYAAFFENIPSSPGLYVQLFAPAAANYTNIKFPDFSKYLGLTSLDLNGQTLFYFAVYKDGTFDEKNIIYKSTGRDDYPNLNLKSVSRNY